MLCAVNMQLLRLKPKNKKIRITYEEETESERDEDAQGIKTIFLIHIFLKRKQPVPGRVRVVQMCTCFLIVFFKIEDRKMSSNRKIYKHFKFLRRRFSTHITTNFHQRFN